MIRWSALILTAGMLSACGGTQKYPAPAEGRSQILVEVKAQRRAGVKNPRSVGKGYGYGSVRQSAGRQYTMVDYRRMGDISVTLSGAGLDGNGPAPRDATVSANIKGLTRQIVLLAPGEGSKLTITNGRPGKITFFCLGDSGDGFDVTVPPRESRTVGLKDPGYYEVNCEEDETLNFHVLVAENSYAIMVRSNGHAFFDNLPPGEYVVTVTAPRLPPWSKTVRVEAGRRETVQATVSVNNLKTDR